MTNELAKTAILLNPLLCPFCDSEDRRTMDEPGVDLANANLILEMICDACGGVWNERYALARIEIVCDPTKATEAGE